MLILVHIFNLLAGLAAFCNGEYLNDGFLIIMGGIQFLCGVAGLTLAYLRVNKA